MPKAVVLIAEDDPDLRQILADALMEEGYESTLSAEWPRSV